MLEHWPMETGYADDAFAAIEKIVERQGIVQACFGAMKLAAMKRTDYKTANGFIK